MRARGAACDPEELRQLLSAGGELRLAVAGRSMLPLFREGDHLVIRPLERPPRVGEVVVFARGGQLWCHRVLLPAGRGRRLLTKGDARGRPDSPVDPGAVVGRAVALERRGRRIGIEGLGARLAGLAVSLSAPAAALGVRLARRAGRMRRGHGFETVGFSLELHAPRRMLAALPVKLDRVPAQADLRIELGYRESATTGGRYGLLPSGRERWTFAAPSVLASINLPDRLCRGELVPGHEAGGLAALLRILAIIMAVGPGEGLALHASAAVRKGKACLFCGPGGAGKSTALARAREAGAEPLADDLVLLRKNESGRWLAWGPPLEAELSPRTARTAGGVPVGALLIPGRGRRLGFERLSPARWATLAAVFPPGMPLLQVVLDRLGDLAEGAPAWRVRFPDQLGGLEGLFNKLEAEG